MASFEELRSKNTKVIKIALGITFVFFLLELVGGLLTNSLALLSDAGHMLTDVLALGMSLFAMWFARRPPTQTHSFGYHRMEIFAAFLNGLTLAGISIYIFIEAYHRLHSPPDVAGVPMLAIAVTGLFVNLTSGYILHDSKDSSLNVRGAYLHVLGDALGSVGAICAGVIMLTTGWMYADPLFSILIGLIIVISSVRLLRDTFHVLMQGTPSDIHPCQVQQSIEQLENVLGIHDLHIWTLTNGIEAMTVHVNVRPTLSSDQHDAIIHRIRELAKNEFGIQHSTIQLELLSREEECCFVKNRS